MNSNALLQCIVGLTNTDLEQKNQIWYRSRTVSMHRLVICFLFTNGTIECHPTDLWLEKCVVRRKNIIYVQIFIHNFFLVHIAIKVYFLSSFELFINKVMLNISSLHHIFKYVRMMTFIPREIFDTIKSSILITMRKHHSAL